MQVSDNALRQQSFRTSTFTTLGVITGLMLGTAYYNQPLPDDQKNQLLGIRAVFRNMLATEPKILPWLLSEFVGFMIEVDSLQFIPPPISFALIGGLFGYGCAKAKNTAENFCKSERRHDM